MIIKMKIIIFSLTILMTTNLQAQTDEQAIAARVEKLRVAMIAADSEVLDELTAPSLNYVHSTGRLETKQEFIENLLSGKSDFVTMDLTDHNITLNGDVAIVRHKLSAQTNDGGKPGSANIGVMQVWQKQNGIWKLIGRQAFKL